VRGLRASMAASISLFSPIASERAPAMASVIQRTSCADGIFCWHNSAPTYANGSAKTVCSTFTSEAKRLGYETAAAAVMVCAPRSAPERDTASGVSCLPVSGLLAREQLERMSQGRPQDREAVPAAPRRTGQVDDQRPVPDARDASREQSVRGLRDRIGADCFGDPRRGPFEHLSRRLGSHVARAEAGAACRQDENGVLRELHDRVGDRLAVVRDDAPLDVEAISDEQLDQSVATTVFTLAGGDAVGHR